VGYRASLIMVMKLKLPSHAGTQRPVVEPVGIHFAD
jgi:hypothetical protein